MISYPRLVYDSIGLLKLTIKKFYNDKLLTMHLILTGATGLIGSSVLDAMLKTAEVTKISILSRRPVPMAENAKDPRVNVIIHKDFLNYDSEVLSKLQGASGAVWALGVSQTKVSKEYVAYV